jgi:hypothetical protein
VAATSLAVYRSPPSWSTHMDRVQCAGVVNRRAEQKLTKYPQIRTSGRYGKPQDATLEDSPALRN